MGRLATVGACVAWLLVGAGTRVGHAQEAAREEGRVFVPMAHPSFPDLIAFERIEGNARELRFMRVSQGTEVRLDLSRRASSEGDLALPDATAGTPQETYSGDLDWRPQAEGGRYWFAFVAGTETGKKLLLHAVDATGRGIDAAPLEVPGGASARHPRWSPDGRHLLFVSERGQLMVIANAASALRAREGAARLRAEPITAAAGFVLYPSWAPAGTNAIAYQIERASDARRRFSIEILQLDPVRLQGVGQPLVIGDGAIGDNLYRPSWAPNARLIAYYIDRVTAGAESSMSMDVGVAEIVVSPSTGAFFRTEVLAGRSPRLAEGVIAHSSRGPAWTTVASAGGTPQVALVYVTRDDTQQNPVIVASVERWRSMAARSEFAVTASARWGTANHRDPSLAALRDSIRYLFVAAAGGGERVEARAVMRPNAAPSATVRSSSPLTAIRRPGSIAVGTAPAWWLIFPGVTQLGEGRTRVGYALAGAGAVGAGLGTVAVLRHVAKGTETEDAPMFFTGAAIGTAALIGGLVELQMHRRSNAGQARLRLLPMIDRRGRPAIRGHIALPSWRSH